MTKILKFVKIRCKCEYTNLVPVLKTFRVDEALRCEECGKVIAELKLTRIRRRRDSHESI